MHQQYLDKLSSNLENRCVARISRDTDGHIYEDAYLDAASDKGE